MYIIGGPIPLGRGVVRLNESNTIKIAIKYLSKIVTPENDDANQNQGSPAIHWNIGYNLPKF